MTSEMVQAEWRLMRAHDMAGVMAVAALVHPDFYEEEAVFRDRLNLYPAGCFVYADDDEILGYVISHPWKIDTLPALNSVLGKLPEDTNTYYIHDIALLPAARSGGAASCAITLMAAQAEADGFLTMALVAVNNSGGFWEKKGFVIRDLPELAEKLKTYSDDARYMVRAG
ncbi:GNAT family N-acetyltransferase [Brucellaceae bacterium D45D]